jgi:two-component system, response regulator PdtaR
MEQLKPVVLIVEDEFLLRMDSAAVMEEAGFEVVQAANADEAIAILGMRSDIGVVFTDIQMPGSMDGLKLARFVRDRWPPIKIVATSGLVAIGDGDLPEGGLFISKPLQRGRDCRDAPEPDWPRVNFRSLRSSPLGFFRRRV